jgi:hypothetical protein
MVNKFEDQYEILKRMLNPYEKPVEFYYIKDLSKLHLPDSHLKLLEFIIEKNKNGEAPFYRDLMKAGVFSDYDSIWNFSRLLRKKGLINCPNIMQFASLVHVRERGRIYFPFGPKNVLSLLQSYSPSKRTSWNKIFKQNLNSSCWLKFHLALVYDDGGPVIGACFGIKLNYVPKS